jgi:hypothetical protein
VCVEDVWVCEGCVSVCVRVCVKVVWLCVWRVCVCGVCVRV